MLLHAGSPHNQMYFASIHLIDVLLVFAVWLWLYHLFLLMAYCHMPNQNGVVITLLATFCHMYCCGIHFSNSTCFVCMTCAYHHWCWNAGSWDKQTLFSLGSYTHLNTLWFWCLHYMCVLLAMRCHPPTPDSWNMLVYTTSPLYYCIRQDLWGTSYTLWLNWFSKGWHCVVLKGSYNRWGNIMLCLLHYNYTWHCNVNTLGTVHQTYCPV